jgi:hypothetical protein
MVVGGLSVALVVVMEGITAFSLSTPETHDYLFELTTTMTLLAVFIVGAEVYIFIFIRGTDDVAGGERFTLGRGFPITDIHRFDRGRQTRIMPPRWRQMIPSALANQHPALRQRADNLLGEKRIAAALPGDLRGQLLQRRIVAHKVVDQSADVALVQLLQRKFTIVGQD